MLAGARLYRLLVLLGVPLRWWCRLEVTGREALPRPGDGVLVVANHDSWLDPLAIGDTLMRAGRPLRFLTKDTLWKSRLAGALLDGIRQIPIRRGASDAGALKAAVDALADGEAVCIFPEGTLSRGHRLRARRGVARLIDAAPDVRVVLVAVSGGTDLIRFPTRPRVHIELFQATDARLRAGEDHAALAERLLAQIRARVAPASAGRHPHARAHKRPQAPWSPASNESAHAAANAAAPSDR